MRYVLLFTSVLLLFRADWLKSRDYDLVETLIRSLSSKCHNGDPSVQCSDDLTICTLSGPASVLARKPEILVECELTQLNTLRYPQGWSLVEGSVEDQDCVISLDGVVVVGSDLLGNLYHNFNLLLHTAVSLLFASTHLTKTEPTILILDSERSNRFPELWKIFRTVTYLPKGGCVRVEGAVLALRTRTEMDLLWSPITQPLPEGSKMLRDITGRVKTALLPSPPSPSHGILYVKRTTNNRQILNEEELLSRLRRYHTVKEVEFDSGLLSFEDQLSLVSSHHILLSVHGAALTHAAFLRPPSALFELYNAGEEHCYRTFAELFGVKYYTLDRRDVRVTYATRPEGRGWVTPKTGNYTLNIDRALAIVRKIYLDLQLDVHIEL